MYFTKPFIALLLLTAVTAGRLEVAANSAPQSNAPPRFTVTQLPAPEGVENVHAVALNDKGQVIIEWNDSKSTVSSWLWERGKTPRSLGQLENGYRLQPLALNNAGQVVGIAWGEDPNYRKRRAFLWENGKARDLGTPAGEVSEAFDINNRGEVFVTSYALENRNQQNFITKQGAFLWTAAKGFQRLPEPFYGMGQPCALNDEGQIVGTGLIGADEWHDTLGNLKREEIPDTDGALPIRAFLYSNGSFRRLPIEHSWSTHAQAINNRGEALLTPELLTMKDSFATVRSGGLYLWRNGKATPIVANSGGRGLIIGMMGESSLNDAGEVVTTTFSGQDTQRQYQAALYRNGTLYTLDDCIPPNSGWRLTSARQINNRGQIIGTGTYKGKTCAFLLTPQ